MTSYNAFARYYDILTSDIDYKKHALYYDTLIKNSGGKSGGILLDLACGTGSLSEQMALLGYDVIGVDMSQEMLSVALDKKLESGLDIQYLCQNMTNLDLFGTIDISICALDSINHLENSEEIEKTFERISLFSDSGGIFIFDMNTVYKHENILSDNIFIYDTPQVYCIWENHFSQKNSKVDFELTFFEKNGKCYIRHDECFSERAYPVEEIERLLKKTGFELIGEYDYMTFDKPHEKSDKIIFLARKAN